MLSHAPFDQLPQQIVTPGSLRQEFTNGLQVFPPVFQPGCPAQVRLHVTHVLVAAGILAF